MPSLLKNRFFWGVVCGLMMGCLFGPPQQLMAQARTSLASLQAAIDGIISGATSVGDAQRLGGFVEADFVRWSHAEGRYALRVDGTANNLTLSTPIIDSVSSNPSLANVGKLYFNSATGTLRIFDGNSWRTLAYAP